MKLTFGEAKSELAEILGMKETDARVLAYANTAARKLHRRGHWVGTTIRYKVCLSDGNITWPRNIETIELWALNNVPRIVHNEWYEMIGNGPGLMNAENSCAGAQLIDRGTAPSFDDISVDTLDRKIKCFSSSPIDSGPDDAGAEIILQGYDQNSQWIRTKSGGVYIDGEKVAVSEAGTLTQNYFTSLVRVVKPVTNLPVSIWEFDSTNNLLVKILGAYDPDETLPVYRRSLVPGLSTLGTSEDCSDGTSSAVVVYAKLRFIPATRDADFYLNGNLEALGYGVKAVQLERREKAMDAEAWWQKAVTELERELTEYLGAGPKHNIRCEEPETWGGAVVNLY